VAGGSGGVGCKNEISIEVGHAAVLLQVDDNSGHAEEESRVYFPVRFLHKWNPFSRFRLRILILSGGLIILAVEECEAVAAAADHLAEMKETH
jgi:hypothetical protein